jgi:hypothetical protein
MSSGTSIKRSSADTGLGPPKRASAEAEALQPWQLFTLAGLIGATIVVFMSRGQTPAAIILLSLMIFAAAFVGLAALRTLLPLTGAASDETTEIVGGRTRAALFREKALVLRAIKELEFDRGMGKVSEKDFGEMSARLRSRAARLIRQLDAGSLYRDEIAREVEQRLAGSASPLDAARDARSRVEPAGHPAHTVQEAGAVERPALCAACDTTNDADAKFCKNCGRALVSA